MILIIDMTNNKLHFLEFVKPIADIIKLEKIEIINHKKINIKKNKIRKADKIIISGNQLEKSNYDIENFFWIKDFDKPLFGICEGMHIICRVYRGKLKNSQEIGLIKIKVLKENKIFSKDFNAYCLHNYAVEIPEEFEVLANSDKCIQAIKHKSKNIYGVLFHPEVRNKEMIERFVNK